MRRYLLDTNILSEPLVSRPSSEVLHRLEENRAQLVTASPVWHELVFGGQRLAESEKRRRIEQYLQSVVEPTLEILPYNSAAAAWHAAERARLTRQGKTPSFVDGQIAAIAFINDAILVTRNTGDFRHFDGLTIENWFAPTT